RIFEEIRTRFREELDYELEAKRQEEFRALHAGDDKIRIPSVVRERSKRRVLTSDLCAGTTLEEAADGSESERRAHAETMWRFVFKGNLVGGKFNADPHPGNYLFAEDGVVTFLDFGCVQPIEGVRLTRAQELHIAALGKDEAAFVEKAKVLLETRGGAYEKAAVEYSRKCFEPLFSPPFRITRSYVAELVDGVRDMKALLFQKDGNVVPLPPGMVFINRLQFGFYSVLSRLDVDVDYAQVERRFFEEAGLL
ncbi:MAG TPA: AarF/UbiB family protein, partial [Polyangiaceae bacterium]|nr:AarF/UbiB family protein [Polyangiaceae bacterium]